MQSLSGHGVRVPKITKERNRPRGVGRACSTTKGRRRRIYTSIARGVSWTSVPCCLKAALSKKISLWGGGNYMVYIHSSSTVCHFAAVGNFSSHNRGKMHTTNGPRSTLDLHKRKQEHIQYRCYIRSTYEGYSSVSLTNLQPATYICSTPLNSTNTAHGQQHVWERQKRKRRLPKAIQNGASSRRTACDGKRSSNIVVTQGGRRPQKKKTDYYTPEPSFPGIDKTMPRSSCQ